MTELFFKGKEFVYNHHLAVPHRPLVADAARSVEAPDLSGNLIIQGDNLHALKSLLPHYAGRVDCIFIDPPYNTGNEGWRYNDKVNAPMIKAWLDENPVGVEDGLRHDKWCAMMWPRLKLLHELLAEDGVIFICIDDNELHNLRSIMDEIFGLECFRNSVVVENDSRPRFYESLSTTHEYLVCYSKEVNYSFEEIIDQDKQFQFHDEIGGFTLYELRNRNISFNRNNRPNLYYPFWVNPISEFDNNLHEISTNEEQGWTKVYPQISAGVETVWRWGLEKANKEKNTSLFAQQSNNDYGFRIVKKYRSKSKVFNSVWTDNTIKTDQGTLLIKSIFAGDKVFDYPKPIALIEKLLRLSSSKDALILDSFAGSGTTAHAVLKANAEDGGNRKFIMVEMEEDIADSVTAERIRRVINGYSHGDKTTDGLGGTFTFCTLGEAIDLNRILSGETLPEHKTLAPVLFHMATNETLDAVKTKSNKPYYVGETEHEVMWMIYEPDLDWLKSDAAALTLSKAKAIAATDPDKDHLVFAPARFVSQKVLKEENLKVKFVPFPDALYQIEREGE